MLIFRLMLCFDIGCQDFAVFEKRKGSTTRKLDIKFARTVKTGVELTGDIGSISIGDDNNIQCLKIIVNDDDPKALDSGGFKLPFKVKSKYDDIAETIVFSAATIGGSPGSVFLRFGEDERLHKCYWFYELVDTCNNAEGTQGIECTFSYTKSFTSVESHKNAESLVEEDGDKVSLALKAISPYVNAEVGYEYGSRKQFLKMYEYLLTLQSQTSNSKTVKVPVKAHEKINLYQLCFECRGIRYFTPEIRPVRDETLGNSHFISHTRAEDSRNDECNCNEKKEDRTVVPVGH